MGRLAIRTGAHRGASTRLRWNRRKQLGAALIAVTALFLLAAASTRTQIEPASIIGQVQDGQGSPVAGVKVTLSSQTYSASVLTQADGRYEFRRLLPGQYRLTAEEPRFRKERVAVSITRADELINQVIRLVPSSLHVAVFDAANQQLGGVTVTLHAQERSATRGIVARAVTDDGGDAYFGRLAPGSYQLTAGLRGYEEYRTEVFISPGLTTELPLQLLAAPVIPINEKAVVRFGLPGLPTRNVLAAVQDSEGWVWFGTERGLARFNGSYFVSSSSAPDSPYGRFAQERINSICEDEVGRVWVATETGVWGMSRDGADMGRATDAPARHVSVDANGLWISTANGLQHHAGGGLVTIDESMGLPSNDVRQTAAASDGRLWVATAKGLAIIDDGRVAQVSHVVRRQPAETGGRRTARGRTEPVDAPIPPEVIALFVDRDGLVWLSTAEGVFVLRDDGLEPVELELRGPRPGRRAERIAAGPVNAISQDTAGNMWFAFRDGGAVLLDPSRKASQFISAVERDRIAAFCITREGRVWLATGDGAVQCDPYGFVNFTTSRGLLDNDVRAAISDPSFEGGRLVFATGSGASLLEGDRFVPLERFRASVAVHAITFDARGAWFATNRGVYGITGQTLTQFNENNGLPSNEVNWALALRARSALVFGTDRGASILGEGPLRGIDQLEGFDIRHVFEDPDGRLWFSTARGLATLDPDLRRAEVIDSSRGLIDIDVRCVVRYDGRLAVATRAGVQLFADFNTTPGSFTVVDSEPASALHVDKEGFLWVGTDDGEVKKFRSIGEHLVSTVYSVETRALTGGRINSIFDDGGTVWIATDKGVVRHRPVRVAPNARVQMEIDGAPVSPSAAGEVDVPYGRHKTAFRFTGVTQSGPVRYLYRIRARDSEAGWQVLPQQGGGIQEVVRYDLSEGPYTFEVMALNNDLYGFEAAPAGIALRVGAPLWKRWWFYALALLLVGGLGVAGWALMRVRDREFVLPRELRHYAPIEPNPYIVGNPIRTEQMFYGREDDFRYVRTKLEGASQGVVIVFCGDRRVGKSSILYQVLNGRLGERFIPVFIDMQEMVIASDAEFFSRMSRLIADAIERGVNVTSPAAVPIGAGGAVAARVAPLEVPSFSRSNPYHLFLDFLDEVLESIEGRTLLLLIDEYELMESKVDEGKLSPEFFTFLAGLMDHKERLALIFTGSRRLEERDKKYWRELLRRSLFRKVGFLSRNDTVRLIADPVANRVVYGRGVVDEVCRLTAGQPFYTQFICQTAVDFMNENRRNWVTRADLKRIIGEVVDNPLPQMIYAWEGFSDDEKLVVSLLAESLKEGESFATASQLRASVDANRYPVNLSEATIRLTLEETFHRDFLEKSSADGFRFKMDLFRLWIQRSHSIWQVVKEVRTL